MTTSLIRDAARDEAISLLHINGRLTQMIIDRCDAQIRETTELRESFMQIRDTTNHMLAVMNPPID